MARNQLFKNNSALDCLDVAESHDNLNSSILRNFDQIADNSSNSGFRLQDSIDGSMFARKLFFRKPSIAHKKHGSDFQDSIFTDRRISNANSIGINQSLMQ